MAALTPGRAAARLCELSSDARAAVLLDAAGAPAGSHGVQRKRGRALAELARELFEGVDRAARDLPGGPPEQVEAQVDGGAVYASRTPRWTLAVVAWRTALSSLMLMDLRAVLGELEGGAPIRRSTAVEEGGASGRAVEEEGASGSAAEEGGASGSAAEREVASESPVPELGREVEDT